MLLKTFERQRYGHTPLKRPSAEWLRALRSEVRSLRSVVRAAAR
jgi:hypothetical protein